jgi:uncharacterized protein
VTAFDDGRFQRGDRYAPLAGVAFVTPSTVEGMVLGRVRVDGLDATERILSLLRAPSFGTNARAILLDGVTFGGFNLVDLRRLYRATGRPVIAITRRPPDLRTIRAALRRYFPRTFARRSRLVRSVPVGRTFLGGRARYLAAVGCTEEEARALLERTTTRGAWPEPLRLAAQLARADRPLRRPAARR